MIEVLRRLQVRRASAAVGIETLGGACLVLGVAMIYVPAALIIAGILMIVIAQGID